jgi:hypothetical protein
MSTLCHIATDLLLGCLHLKDLLHTTNHVLGLPFMLGMASPLVGIAAVNALLFTAYSNLKKLQEPYPGGPLTLGQIAIAGAGAGMDSQWLQLLSPVHLNCHASDCDHPPLPSYWYRQKTP